MIQRLFISVLVLGFSSPALANIFGPDDRKVVETFPEHLKPIGSIEGCTANLVARNFALTSAHCLVNEKGERLSAEDIHFQAARFRNQNLGESAVREIHWPEGAGKFVSADWALLELEEPLGDSLGWFRLGKTTKQTKVSELPAKFQLGGYSEDHESGTIMTLDESCSVRGKDSYLFLHDCAFTYGASGAGLLSVESRPGQSPVVTLWALNAGSARPVADGTQRLPEYDAHYGNGAIPTQDIIVTLSQLLSKQEIASVSLENP